MWHIEFAHPGLLYLAIGAAVPVIIHLLRRRRVQVVRFPAVRFLRKSSQRRKTKTNLKHLLLLLMRMALVALLAVILARPFVSRGRAAAGGDLSAGAAFGISTSAVVILDDSLSMNCRRGGSSWFEKARDHALEILGQLPPDSEAALTTTSRPAIQFVRNADSLRGRLIGMQPTLEAPACWSALEQAAKALQSRPAGSRNIFLLTDLTRAAWPGIERRGAPGGTGGLPPLDLGEAVALDIVDAGESAAANLAVTRVSQLGEPALKGAVLKIEAELLSVAEPAQEMVQFEFDGLPVRRQMVRIAADGVEKWQVEVPIKSTGHHWGRVSFLNPDALPQDNARTFTVEAAESVSVLCADPSAGTAAASEAPSRSYFFRTALMPWAETQRGIFRVTTVRPEQLRDAQLAGFDMIALVDTPLADDVTWKRLADFVGGGGGLFVSLGPGTEEVSESPTARKLLPALGAEVVEAPAASGGALFMRVVSTQHPLVDALSEAGADLGRVRFRKCRRLKLSEMAEEVFSFGPEMPALALGRSGGRVAVFAADCQGAWSTLALDPEFVPFCQELALYLSGAPGGRISEYPVGQHVPVRYEESRWPTDVDVFPPGSQDAIRLMPAATPGRRFFARTDKPGYYRVHFKRHDVEWDGGFAVNTASSESDLRRLEPKELERAIKAARVKVHADASTLAAARGAGGPGGTGREVTTLFVMLALALCLGEIFLANRIYRSAPDQMEEPPAAPAPKDDSTMPPST